MTIRIARAYHDALEFDLAEAVSAFQDALVAHAETEGVPAPTADPLVEAIVADGGAFEIVEPPPLPAMPIPDISDRQFAHGLWKRGIITKAQALAFVKVGEIPQPLLDLLEALPEDERDDAEMIIAGATAYERGHPVTVALVEAFGWTIAEGDAAWREFALL